MSTSPSPAGADPAGTGGEPVPVRRRTVLAGLGLAGLGALTGCAGETGSDTVRVGVGWSGAELARFRDALDDFPGKPHVSVFSLGDDTGALLAGQVARGVAPDVAILSQPGWITGSSGLDGRLADLTVQAREQEAPPFWAGLAKDHKGIPRGVWYKAAHKSLVWYDTAVFAERGLTPPQNWVEWLQVRRAIADAGDIAPFALGAADGWVLTDWFENLLLGLDAATFEGLAAGSPLWDSEPVARALTWLAELWSSPESAFPGGVRRALQTQFADSVLDVTAERGTAAMVLGGDFAFSVARQFSRSWRRLAWFRVPAPPGGRPPVLVGGDLAVLLGTAGTGGRDLIDWLVKKEAAAPWARAGGFISLRPDVTDYPEQYGALPEQVRGGAGSTAFDLSDRLPAGALSGGGRALEQILRGFLTELDGRNAATVVGETVAALRAAADRRHR